MKNGRNTAGKFTSGNSGRPKGARNKKTLAIESLLEGQAKALTQTAISKRVWRLGFVWSIQLPPLRIASYHSPYPRLKMI